MSEARPLRLELKRDGADVQAQIIGTWRGGFAASFVLEISAAGNSSIHKGRADSQSADEVVFSTYRAGGVPEGRFSARLTVSPDEGEPYQMNQIT